MGRRALLIGLAGLAVARVARGGDVGVPPGLQAQLMAKVAAFDRNFAARAAGRAVVLIVKRPGDSDSARMAAAVAGALGELPDIAGVPRSVEVISYAGAASLASSIRTLHASIVYLSSGLESEAGAMARALAGMDVLTVGATGTLAEGGANVGFDLEGSRPKIVINLATCKAQGVSLKAELLKLGRMVGG